MPLVGNTKQNKGKSLEDFYTDLMKDERNPVWSKIGAEMAALVRIINELFTETTIWGLTSHSMLVLQTVDKWDAEGFVMISSTGSGEYNFEYLMPEEKKPRGHATVKGMTTNLEGAKRFLLISMRESGGWRDNKELNRLLVENGLK